MKKSILFITSLFLCIFCLKSNAQQSRTEVTWEKMEDVTVPVPPQVHPRLYVRSADLPDLKKRMNHPHVKDVLATLTKLGKDRTPEEEAKVKDRGFRYYFEMRGVTSRCTRCKRSTTWYTVIRNKPEAPLPPCWTHFRTSIMGQRETCHAPAV